MADMVVKQIRGRAFYAKLFKAVPNYNKDGFEWAIDVALDAKARELIESLGLGSKIKNKGTEAGDFITFKRATVKASGEKKGQANDPIRVVGPDGETPWDTSKLIGNESVVNVKFSVSETMNPRTKVKGMRADPLSIQVWEHVAYVPKSEFEANTAVKEAEEPAKDW